MKPGFMLQFDNIEGTEEPEAFFCTFRLGRGWEKKLEAEDWVYLATKTTVYQRARVISVVSGPAKKMIRKHGQFHHLEMGIKPGMNKRRLDGLIKLYGPQKMTEDSILTVIYLQNGWS